ncbi:hypothetical protein G3O01_22450 [Burkholderia sp. Ac-20365]|nr:hypothetical protein [Burkholderia sp. Ac-20365]
MNKAKHIADASESKTKPDQKPKNQNQKRKPKTKTGATPPPNRQSHREFKKNQPNLNPNQTDQAP